MGHQVKSRWTLMASSVVLAMGLATPASAADSFDGETLRVKLIGGAQYEPLYTLISEWEKKTGAKVEVLSRKNHFELDREIKQDIAAGNINYCVSSNHTSFALNMAISTPILSLSLIKKHWPLMSH